MKHVHLLHHTVDVYLAPTAEACSAAGGDLTAALFPAHVHALKLSLLLVMYDCHSFSAWRPVRSGSCHCCSDISAVRIIDIWCRNQIL